jgi:pyruvate formate lyase activating enzyme
LPEEIKKILPNLIKEEAFFNFLKKRKWTLTGVSICGWEPTLQKDLKEFCKKVKDLWFNIKLDTNWRNPKIIKELIDEKLVDYVAMDIKQEIWKWNDIIWVKIAEALYLKTIELLLNSDVNYEFRTTIIKWVHTIENIENMAKYISGAKNYFLQNYRNNKTLDPLFTWEKFDSKELGQFKEICEKYIKNVGIRE